MVLMLLLAALGSSPGAAVAASKKDTPKADPRLLELASQHPDELFHVIVQRDAKNKDLTDEPDKAFEVAGGRVDRHKRMDFIVGFAGEVTGKHILQLAKLPKVHWISFDAPMLMQGGFDLNTYRDEFTSVSYAGSNGTDNWSALPWSELGEADGPAAGNVRVAATNMFGTAYALRIGSPLPAGGGMPGSTETFGASRALKLSGATAATLSFTVRRQLYAPSAGSLYLQATLDGVTWYPVDAYAFSASDRAPVTKSYDFSGLMNGLPVIRFVADSTLNGYVYIDNVQVEYTRLTNSYIRTTKTNSVWSGTAAPGAGVTVAVVDSGVSDHPDLYSGSASRVVASVSFARNSLPTEPVGYDDYGHGTHVAGIIAGAGQASLGAVAGIAPAVKIVNVKVSGADGSSYMSDVLAGLQWIYDNRAAYNIKVVNISLNSSVPESYNASPLDAAVEILWFNGITVVVSAGNNGTAAGPAVLLPPANDPFVITVGATDDMGTPGVADDSVPAFSAYGTTEDGYAKPDLVAPGRNIISLLASTSSTGFVEHPANRVDSYYFRMSGTSMAAPMVSGAVALLLQQNPALTPDQIKYRLKATADPTMGGYDPARAGAGELNVYAAVKGTTTDSANTGIDASSLLATGSDPVAYSSVGWNSVGWNTVGWNSVGWNSVGWNTVGWNTVGWNTSIWEP